MPVPRRLVAALVLSAAAGLACGGALEGFEPTPVPDDKADYVGTWEGGEVTLTITEGGMVDYERGREGSNTSLDAPIQSWHATGFDVGIGPLVTTFEVSEPPHLDDGVWKMTVDGVELTRDGADAPADGEAPADEVPADGDEAAPGGEAPADAAPADAPPSDGAEGDAAP